MGHKKKIIGIIGICIASIVVSLVLALPEVFGLCAKSDTVCIRGFIHRFDNFAQFILYFAIAIGIIAVWVYFLSEKVFKIWGVFTVVYLIASAFMVFISPNVGSFLNIDKELVTIWTAGIFFVVSIGIILGKREK